MAKRKNEKPGQPTKYEPRFCDVLIEHMAGGLSFKTFAGIVRVTRKTLYNWSKAHADFKDAHDIGKSAHALYWETQGRDGLYDTVTTDDDGNKVTKKLNATVYCAIMNNGPWRALNDKARKERKDDSADAVKELFAQFMNILNGSKNE